MIPSTPTRQSTLEGATERILVGHFLTRAEAARAGGVSPREIAHRPDLLRIGGTHLEEVYFAFQFDDRGVRRELATVVRFLRRTNDDVTIADWLARPNDQLSHLSPLRWLAAGHDPRRVVDAATTCPPLRSAPTPTPPQRGDDVTDAGVRHRRSHLRRPPVRAPHPA